jgi:hypothetical protein
VRVRLVYPDRDLDLQAPPAIDVQDVVQDLCLAPLFEAMAGGDALIQKAAQCVILAHMSADPEVVQYRQDALADCLAHPSDVQALYACAGEGLQAVRDLGLLRLYSASPGSTLYGALRVLDALLHSLRRLRGMVQGMRDDFRSKAFDGLFSTIADTLDEAFFEAASAHRHALELRRGVVLSARLGRGNRGADLRLLTPAASRRGLLDRLRSDSPRGVGFSVAPHDEDGQNALRELCDQALSEVANAMAQANDHVLAFLDALRCELAFYLGCMRLDARLVAMGIATCRPEARPGASAELTARALVDASLALAADGLPVPNDVDADGWAVLVVTGANRGGKTVFLRALGQALLMQGAGMRVAASAFRASLADGLFTHFKREEDATMTGGKLDEELTRLAGIVRRTPPYSVLLMNESLASTNEAEGSELAAMLLAVLQPAGVRVAYVTHLYAFADALAAEGRSDVRFLRAERRVDGTRTFRIVPGTPRETSYAEDVFRQVFREPGS